MLPLRPGETSRVETTIRTDDYELLCRVAKTRRTSVASIIRNLLYEHVQPLKTAQHEREELSLQRAREQTLLRKWTGQHIEIDVEMPERGDQPPLKYPS